MKTRTLSVVIASGEGGAFLPRCLDSLREQILDQELDLLVVDRCGSERQAQIKKDYPFATVLGTDLDHRPSVPELRAIGVSRAKTDLVAIIEEHCIAAPDWIKQIVSSFRDGDAAIGGPILDNDFTRIRDWVVYFSEYHNYLPPWPDGEPYYLLNDANICYDREKLLKHKEVLGNGYWGAVLHPNLSKEGLFRSVPAMRVYHTGPFDYAYYLSQRYLLSRAWGGAQRDRVGHLLRLAHIGAAPIMPIFLLARITMKVLGNRQRIGKYIMALPLLTPALFAYAWGEFKGYAFGVGDSLERVE